MDRKLLKCPACGGNLNVETDSDNFFCRHCGAKLIKDADRLLFEHAGQKMNGTEAAKRNHEGDRIAVFRKCRRIGNIAAAAIFAASFLLDRLASDDHFGGELKVIAIGIFAIVNLLYYILFEIGQRRS